MPPPRPRTGTGDVCLGVPAGRENRLAVISGTVGNSALRICDYDRRTIQDGPIRLDKAYGT